MAGNANSGPKKEKPFRDALLLAISDAEASANPQRSLRKLAERLLDKAADGDMNALKEIADRVDGKVPQAIEGGDEPLKQEHTIIVTGVPRKGDDASN